MSYQYLAIGDVTEDVWGDGSRSAGGTVLYSSRTARAFFERVAVLTTAADAFDLTAAFPGIDVTRVPSPHTTEFENVYFAGHRQQVTRPSPVVLTAQHLNPSLMASQIIHLAPVCDEISIDLVRTLPSSAFIGVTPQGWMRRWDEAGKVTRHHSFWNDARAVLEMADATVLSLEDVEGDLEVVHEWARRSRLLVVTQGWNGCSALFNGAVMHIGSPKVQEVDPTGAGDIFATSLFIALYGSDGGRRLTHARVRKACEYANCIAAQSVTRRALHGIPNFDDAKRCSTI